MDLKKSLHSFFAFEDQENEALVALRLRIGPVRTHRDVTFGELREQAASRAAALLQAGCTRGSRVALLMPHGEELFYTFFSCLYSGLIPCVIAWPTTKMDAEKYRRNITAVVTRLHADFLLTDATSAERLGSVLESTIVLDPSTLAPGECASAHPSRDGVFFIQFSGGTTGVQKSVPVSHEILRAQIVSYAESIQLTRSDRIISWLPLYHDMGLVACLLMPFVFRVPVSLFAPMEWVMDPRAFLEQIGPDEATLAWLPNFAFSFMAARIKQLTPEMKLDSMRAIINCSEPVRAESMDAFYERYASAGLKRIALQACYAMAETVFAVSQTTIGAEPERLYVSRSELGAGSLVASEGDDSRCLVSSGKLIRGVEVKIVGEDGLPSDESCIGEICVRAPFVMSGYLDASNSVQTSLVATDWYHTGDLGALRHGQLFISGRKKDLIIVGGVNVFPEDVEAATNAVDGVHPGRTVAVGLADAKLGTDRLVIVAEVNHDGDLSRSAEIEGTIRSAVSTSVGVAPSLVVLVPPRWIVKSTAGKISRGETKARLVANWHQLTEGRHGEVVPDE